MSDPASEVLKLTVRADGTVEIWTHHSCSVNEMAQTLRDIAAGLEAGKASRSG
jgi:hypothetical protein